MTFTRSTMDLVGNRLKQETDNDATAQAISQFDPTLPGSLTPDQTTDYSYDANDRLQWAADKGVGRQRGQSLKKHPREPAGSGPHRLNEVQDEQDVRTADT